MSDLGLGHPLLNRGFLLIGGSPQERSSNRSLLDVASNHLDRLGEAATRSIPVGILPPFNPDDQALLSVPLSQFRDQIRRSRGVLIATPEYAAAIPGMLKNALDWIVGSAELYTKPVAILSAGTTGGELARAQLIRSLTWQGAHVVAQLGVAAPRTKSDRLGRITDTATVEAVNRLVEVLVGIDGLTDEDRFDLVARITSRAGVEAGHIAPLIT